MNKFILTLLGILHKEYWNDKCGSHAYKCFIKKALPAVIVTVAIGATYKHITLSWEMGPVLRLRPLEELPVIIKKADCITGVYVAHQQYKPRVITKEIIEKCDKLGKQQLR